VPDDHAQVVDDGVDFVIGGHPFRVPIPSLYHAKVSGKFLSPGLVAAAEQAIDLVLAHSDDAVGLEKDTLLKGCSLGEAVKLADGLRTLMQRAGLPMVPTAPPASAMPPSGPLSQTVELELPAPAERSPNFSG
jgi:hypothetical protein